MVQEYGSKSNMNAVSAVSQKAHGYAADPAIRKVSQYGSKKNSVSKSFSSQKTADSNAQKYGAWGAFKNKDNFVNMHLF